jgi:hypothetical protein
MLELMTGQVELDSYVDAGVLVAVELVNEPTLGATGPAGSREQVQRALARILAFDRESVAHLRPGDSPGFVALAGSLQQLFHDFDRGDFDSAAARLNAMLDAHPAHPHLAKEDGRWRLHHHPRELAVLPMWTSICAEALARMLGAGHGQRFGVCEAPDCDRVFFDVSKNASRRFCSTTCQNRVKATAFRARQGARAARIAPRRPRR